MHFHFARKCIRLLKQTELTRRHPRGCICVGSASGVPGLLASRASPRAFHGGGAAAGHSVRLPAGRRGPSPGSASAPTILRGFRLLATRSLQLCDVSVVVLTLEPFHTHTHTHVHTRRNTCITHTCTHPCMYTHAHAHLS